MKLLIFYLTNNNRHHTFPHFVKLLDTSAKKDDWELMVLTDSNDAEFYDQYLKNTGVHHSIHHISGYNNYMDKVRFATQYAEEKNIPYMMKCDNDIFFNAATLDYMVANLGLLDSGKFLTLGPTLSSGIPSVENFTRSYLFGYERATVEKMFLNTQFYDRDGASYAFLNEHTIGADTWDSAKFFTAVRSMNHHYKGIHPIRINMEAINYVNQCILQNKSKFFQSAPSGVIEDTEAPYLCDSVFCIRRDVYKQIIHDSSLFVDAYDEVPLNKYAWQHGMGHLFVENGFGIHILYNWFSNLHDYERQFCNQLFG